MGRLNTKGMKKKGSRSKHEIVSLKRTQRVVIREGSVTFREGSSVLGKGTSIKAAFDNRDDCNRRW